ncbi:restriction endonuclease [Sinorhizobium meliloti]|nr:restriction endonuclease [Sinorhizobium meliloti]
MAKIVRYENCDGADLIVDAVYEGEAGGRLSGEALSRLLPGVGNQGGFRPSGRGDDKRLVALYTSGEDKDWPDSLDLSTGQFVYYGDNKHPGHELHDTQRSGNLILRRVFSLLHASPPQRPLIPPFFVFKKYPTAVSARSFQFKGLAVPGFVGLPPTADLVAVWKTTEGQRFQNYRAVFTVLNAGVITRAWIDDLAAGRSLTANAPTAWVEWVERGRYRALTAESTTVIRSVASQLPETPLKAAILDTIWKHFAAAPIAFEAFAARIFQMYDPRVVIDEITRGSIDGGRDAIGRYRIGLIDDPVYAEFSLEAKCYRPANGNDSANTVGVKEVARLISRIRHREFGVLVTTSAVARQAYEEVREDRHPIIFLCGRDIVDILSVAGFNTPQLVSNLLNNEFAVAGGAQ